MRSAQTKSVTLRLDVDVNRELDRYCEKANCTKSLLVNCALADFLRAPEKDRFQVVKDYVVRARVKR